ncbi:MAG: hypothetical protein ACOYJI_04690 [Anaerovoracaceae bacterium]|jgi:hypothetical protein
MMSADGDLMTHSFLIMGGIIIGLYLAIVLIHMLVSKLVRRVRGDDESARAEKIMEELRREEETEKNGSAAKIDAADLPEYNCNIEYKYDNISE